jgi:chemotaxis protein MotB
MKQEQNKQKIILIGGLVLVVIASLGGYLYNTQQDKIRSLADESEEMRQDLSNELSQSRQEIDLLNNRIQQLTQDQSALQDSLDAEQASRQELQDSLDAEQASRQQLQAELEAAREHRLQVEQAMQLELQSLTTVSSELEKELQARLAQQEMLDARIEKASGEKQQLLTRLESEREKRRQLQQQIERVSGDDSRHFAELEQRLKQELNESRFEISQLQNRMTVIKLTSEVLFNSGSAQIKPAGREVLSLIAESLNGYPDRDINIEGHTDSVPIGKNSRYTSNWELSTARALAAVDYFQQIKQIDPKRLKVVGHGEHHPVSSNETREGRQLNRRIEIRLLPGTGN